MMGQNFWVVDGRTFSHQHLKMVKISFLHSVILVFFCSMSFAESSKSLLKAYNKNDCKDFESSKFFEHKNVYETPWLKIKKDTKSHTLNAEFKCANGEIKKLRLDIGPETDGGETVKKVICDRNFLSVEFTEKLGEGTTVSYVDLRNCANLGSGDEEHYSPDKKFLVLTSNGTDAGYVDAELNVIDCRGQFCKKLWGGTFGQDGFFDLKWKDTKIFTVERDDRLVTGEGPK
ncbi:MAG: hypothetical protein ACAH59_00790, partial [Pseudobdellovibrionaceae bacterium]